MVRVPIINSYLLGKEVVDIIFENPFLVKFENMWKTRSVRRLKRSKCYPEFKVEEKFIFFKCYILRISVKS